MTDSMDTVEKLNKVEADAESWLKRCLDIVPGVNHPNALDTDQCFTARNVSKETIGKLLFIGIKLVCNQHNILKTLHGEAHTLKNDLISCQSSVIKLQEELISAKNVQIADIKSSVSESVKSAVVMSYSEVVQATQTRSPSNGPIICKDTLQGVVKHVVEEEDRNRNLMIFGLAEEDDENVE